MNKEKLINTIKEITDETLLDDIYRLLHMERVEEPFITNVEQKTRILKAKSEVIHGKTIDSKKADKEIDEWLKR